MSAFEKIKLQLGKYNLKKKQKKLSRNIKSFSIDSADYIGILYDATNRNNYETVKKFVHYLKEERKKVLSLGYINSNNSSEIVSAHLNYIFFDNTSLSKKMIPKSSDVNRFITTPFSILIDLNINESFPLEYICSLSKARFKVGAKGNYRDKECDLILNIDSNKTVEFLIIQVKHYLKMIKN